jgi:hypothetical protein
VELAAYAARDWRANFFPGGIAHSIVGGSACEPDAVAGGTAGGVGGTTTQCALESRSSSGRGIASEPFPHLIDAQTLDHENEGGDRFALHLAGDVATMGLDCLLRTA